MTGEIIHFQSHRDLKRGQLHRKQTGPHRTRTGCRLKEPVRSSDPAHLAPEAGTTQALQPQAARIAHLPDEGDPQPDIDCETLDRMYRELDSEA